MMRHTLDDDLKARVVSFLAQRKASLGRSVGVETKDGQVTLRGRVKSFYDKQLCLTCFRQVTGVVNLIDRIEVAY